MPEEKPPTDRAFELIVYAPIGAALYARDMLPTMLGIFVNRGKREVQSHRAPPAPPPPPEVRRRVEGSIDFAKGAAAGSVGLARDVAGTGVGFARDVAGTAIAGFLQWRTTDDPTGTGTGTGTVAGSASSVDGGTAASTTPPAVTAPAGDAAGPTPATPVTPAVESLAIPDYDELSASQVVERLDGLDPDSLDAIRRYEAGHRGRNTILGKIAQLG